MPLFSSLSNTVDRIYFPINNNYNSSVSYFGPILQGRHVSVTTIAAVAAIIVASYHVLFNVFEIGKPKGYRDIPQLKSWHMVYDMLFHERPRYKHYKKFMQQTLETHGIARMNQFGRSIIYLGTPEYARQMLLHTETFKKIVPAEQFPNTFVSHFFGNNIVFANGSQWKHHRKVCNPAFHKSWPTDTFGNCTNPMLHHIMSESKKGESVDMSDMFRRLTLDAIGKAAFDFNFDAVNNPDGEYVSLYRRIVENAFTPLYILLPWLDSLRFFRRNELHKAVADFDQLILKVIDEKRRKLREANEQGITLDNKDLLTMMIQANESDEDPLTNEELRADVVIFFMAGHDTTANALTSAMYQIAIHPELQERLHEEICNIIGPANDSNSTPTPTLAQVKSMTLLEAVIKESMRIYPSAPMLPPRHVSSNTQVGPYIIPPGAEVQLYIYSIHHNPKYWDDPEEFRPERFLQSTDNNMEKRDPTTWVPFSYGSRSCIGTNFSLIEQHIVLSMIIHRFKFSLPDGSPHKDEPQFSSRGGTFMKALKLEFTPRY